MPKSKTLKPTAMNKLLFALAFTLTAANAPKAHSAESPAPPLDEVLGLIRTNLPEISPEELNAAAVRGLVGQIGARVTWIESEPPDIAGTNLVPVAELLDERFVLVRVGEVADGLTDELQRRVAEVAKDHDTSGLVLDLRFADGWAYAEVVRLAGLFLKEEKPVLDWGDGAKEAGPAGLLSVGPVMVLVNARTSGAAEALAGVLRAQGVGLTLGGRTAGEAFGFKDHPLSAGGSLRIASGRVRLGDGSELPADGLTPDVRVTVPLDQQQQHVRDPEIARTTATQGRAIESGVRRMTEADLVRLHREGISAVTNTVPVQAGATAAPPVTDPVLARALDLLRGLAILRPSQD